MSQGYDALALKEEDVMKMLSATTHIGATNCDFQMEHYIYKRRNDGVFIINLRKTWEKLMLAARAIVAVENPADICVISNRQFGQRAILKFSSATGTTPYAGRFTPGSFTNQNQKVFREPRLLVVTDPRSDHQPVLESAYVNIPVIGFCNTDSPAKLIDIAIPCNNKSKHSLGLVWWLLAREVLRLRGTIPRDQPWDVMCDLYFFREPDEIAKDEQVAAEKEQQKEVVEPEVAQPDWGNEPQIQQDWAESAMPPPGAGDIGGLGTTVGQIPQVEDWSAAPPPTQQQGADEWKTSTDDWGASTGATGWN